MHKNTELLTELLASGEGYIEPRFELLASGDSLIVYIKGKIGPHHNYLIKEGLRSHAGIKDITVKINSFGGHAFAGFDIYNTLKDLKANVNLKTEISGVAASAASYIFLAADPENRSIAENSFYMIHNPYRPNTKASELEAKAKINYINLYAAESNLSEGNLSAAMDKTTWYGAQDAIDAGFASKITHKVNDDAFDLVALADLENLPEKLINKKTKEPKQMYKKLLELLAKMVGVELVLDDEGNPSAEQVTELENALEKMTSSSDDSEELAAHFSTELKCEANIESIKGALSGTLKNAGEIEALKAEVKGFKDADVVRDKEAIVQRLFKAGKIVEGELEGLRAESLEFLVAFEPRANSKIIDPLKTDDLIDDKQEDPEFLAMAQSCGLTKEQIKKYNEGK